MYSWSNNKLDGRIPKLSDFSDMTNELFLYSYFFILRSPIRITLLNVRKVMKTNVRSSGFVEMTPNQKVSSTVKTNNGKLLMNA